MKTIRTSRLILRPWNESDKPLFASLNADPRVMEYFPSVLSSLESDQLADKIQSGIDSNGWGPWAVELIDVDRFIGFIGLSQVTSFEAHFTPAVEIGWRLAFDYWGKGLATEGAKAALCYGFETLKLPEIVAFTTKKNHRSRSVMEKMGMHRDSKDDFEHPQLIEGHPLRGHVLYRINSDEWKLVQK